MPDRRSPTFRLEGSCCPQCGVELIAASNTTSAEPPTDGAVAVCGECGGVGVFGVTALGVVSVRPPTEREEAELSRDPLVRAARGALAESYDSWDAADLAYRGDGDA